jgi:sugar lactone lactonase YvrE
MLGAAVAATALALGGGTAAAVDATTSAAEVVTPAISRYESDGPLSAPLVAGADGALWSFESAYDRGHSIARYGSSGLLSSADSPTDEWPITTRTPLVPQPDGGMALVVSGWGALPRHLPALVRVDARGKRARAVTLPRSARTADAFAVGGDGAVWYVDTCADTLYRWHAGERLGRYRMRPEICAGTESSSALTVGPDGAVWFVNALQGRVIRRDARGRMRQWNFKPSERGYGKTLVVADPRGGSVAFSDGSPWATTGGIVTRAGRYVASYLGAPAFGINGRVWQAGKGRVIARSAGGKVTSISLSPRVDPVDLAVARDGALWFTAGAFEAPPSSESFFTSMSIGTVTEGRLSSWPLGSDTTWGPVQYGDAPTPLTLGGDGAFWTRVSPGMGAVEIARIAPPDLRAPRKPAARVTGVLARSGRTVVVQVRCDADRGRFCRGSVQLAGAAKAVRWIAPGQSGAAVSLTLNRGAARTVQRRGALKTTAVVRATGAGTTRSLITLRRSGR